MDLKRIIANNIFILRNKYGLTQQEFADKLHMNLTRGHISHIENGDNMPSAEFIKSVCISFNVSSDWLLDCNISNPHSYSFTDKDILVATKFHDLDSTTQNAVLNLINTILDTR